MILNSFFVFTGTFNVQNVSIKDKSTMDEVCSQCIYINGISDTAGCAVQLDDEDKWIDINYKELVCKELFNSTTEETHNEVVEYIPFTRTYNVSVYDVTNGSKYTIEPAYTTTVLISGLIATTVRHSSSSPITTTMILPSTSGKLLVCNISMKYYLCLCAVLPSIYSSSNTVVVPVILAIGMLTAHITDDTNCVLYSLYFSC